MRRLQSQGVHHITLVGADRHTSIDNEAESHLYFDPGDGRLITVFTEEGRHADPARTPTDPGCVHHNRVRRLPGHVLAGGGAAGRAGLLIELASYRFERPFGYTHADVLLEAHELRTERGDHNIDRVHLADAIEALVERSRESLSEDRSPKDPYRKDE